MKKIISSISIAVSLSIASLSSAQASPVMDEIGEQYVRLVLATGEHDAAYVDAYYGPKNWQKDAHANQISLDKILLAAKLVKNTLALTSIDADEVARQKFLQTQLNALIARVEMLQGKQLTFDQQSKALYDTEAPHYPLSKFDEVLTRLEKLLPGEGSLAERSQQFHARFQIAGDKLDEVFKKSIDICRQKTLAQISLPDAENFTLEYVTDKPWSGYNWYQGNAQSLIQVNREFPVPISRAIDLGCHEGYPGHHTYNALLEENLVKKKGWIELSVYPLFSPQSLIAEGSANYGIELAFPEKTKSEFERQTLYPLAGINPELAAEYDAVQSLMAELSYVGNELARQYLDKQIGEEEAVKLIQHYTLVDEKKAQQRLKFWQTYGAYVINYNWGKDLVKNWVEKGSSTQQQKWEKFKRLLSSPMLPSDLVE